MSIVLLLQNNGRMTSGQLAERLEVSERTIIRDMESLSTAGVPVYAERGAVGGWLLADGYRTNLTSFREEELVALLVTGEASLLGDLGIDRFFDAGMQKLLAAAPAGVSAGAAAVRQKVHVDGAGWQKSGERFPLLPVVQEAVWEERLLSVQYSRGEEQVERVLQPLGLVAKRSVWYLVALADGEIRTFRISRLLGAELLADRFERPPDFDLAACWEQSTADFRQRLPQYPARLKLLETILQRLGKERYVEVGDLRLPKRAG